MLRGPVRTLLLGALLLSLSLGCARRYRNVVFITFDTTRADAVGYAANRPNLTPNLDQLASNGTWFSNCITSAPLTVPAHSTIFTGLMPYHHGARNNGTYVLDKKNTTLAEVVKQAGYGTHAIVSSFVLDSQFGLDQGFDSYDDDLSAGPQQKMFMFREIKANQTANKAINWLRNTRPADKPFFLWLHFFDPHADHEPPQEFAERFPGERYEAEIAFADRELGRVVKTLDELKLRDDTLIVMTSDHGESLGDHGERTHGIFAYDGTLRVPLLFSGKGVEKRRVDAQVRTADIAPTVAEMLGLSLPNVDGASLTGLMKGKQEKPRLAYSESFTPRLNFGWSELRTMRSLDMKYIEAPRPEIYDLKKDADEMTNLYPATGELPAAARPLALELKKIVASDPFTHGRQRESNLDPETKRKLAALGYVWGADNTKNTSRPDPKDRIVYWDRFEQAQGAIRRHDYAAALMMVRSVLEADRDNVVVMASMANVLMRINQRGDALNIYKRMIELDPNRETGYLGAAAILRDVGQFAEAEAYGRTVMKLQPDNPEGYTAVGDVLLDQQKYAEAEAMFRKAIAIDPHSPVAISGLGNCLNRTGRLRDALKVLRDGHEHDPYSELISYNLGVVVERLGDPDGAKKLYLDTLKIDPEHSMAWNNLGALYDRAGNREEAIRCVTRARQGDPLNLEAAYNLGVLLLAAGKNEEALANLNDTLRLRPTFVPAALQRARALTLLGRTDEALVAWKQLTAVNPAAWINVAKIEISRGHEKEARAALREGLARAGPEFRDAANSDEQLRPLMPKTTGNS
jgi:arylsulfatase A-like enzyme/Flp pilus assembly protein TadD